MLTVISSRFPSPTKLNYRRQKQESFVSNVVDNEWHRGRGGNVKLYFYFIFHLLSLTNKKRKKLKRIFVLNFILKILNEGLGCRDRKFFVVVTLKFNSIFWTFHSMIRIEIERNRREYLNENWHSKVIFRVVQFFGGGSRN